MKKPEDLKKIIDEAVEKLKKDIADSPWQIYPDVNLIDVINSRDEE